MKTHGQKGTKLYNTWRGMRNRTRNKSHRQYKDYGGRGIKVCDEWNSFENFYKWAMENGYKEGLSIDRINNDKDYCPENCKFSTRIEQANNKRNNHILTFCGKSQNLEQWSKEKGLTRGTIYSRLRKGWSVEKTLGTPMLRRRKLDP